MGRILIKNAKAIVTLDKQDRVLKNQNILVGNGRISYLGEEATEADEIIDGTSMFVYPGLINTHHHLYQTFTRNLPQVQHMELFDWLTSLYQIWRGINSEMIYYSSLIGMGELMKYGCTTCFDHHYVFPRAGAEDFIDTQFDAAERLGIRFHASRGSMSRGVSEGGLPPDSLVQSVDTILMDSERLINKFHDPSELSMRRIVLSPCSPFSVTSELMTESVKLARKKGVRLHTHLGETLDEENYCLENFGMRPLKYMESLEWLGSDVWFAHGIHFNEEEIKRLADTGTGIAHCPASNMKLSSGVAKITEMLAAGVKVGLAVDGSASNDGSNLLSEMRAAYLLQRLVKSSKAPDGYRILKMAASGGASILGREDIGSIEINKAADLFMIDASRLELAGALGDPKALLATVGFNHPVDYTMINGKMVVKNGNIVNFDEEKVAAKANELVNKLINNSSR